MAIDGLQKVSQIEGIDTAVLEPVWALLSIASPIRAADALKGRHRYSDGLSALVLRGLGRGHPQRWFVVGEKFSIARLYPKAKMPRSGSKYVGWIQCPKP